MNHLKAFILPLFFVMVSGCSSSDQPSQDHNAEANAEIESQRNNLAAFATEFYHFYQPFNKTEKQDLASFIQKHGDTYLTPDLKALLLKDIACRQKGEICKLDFDPFYAVQDDVQFTGVKMMDHDQVRVQFSDEVDVVMVFDCRQNCRIENIIYDQGEDLRSLLEATE
ncbi:hypothetical protein EC844_12336 [Acinetobacter calcoaceticus]|uniref:DUF3828 domain-containing protein n=1 Tax=Acinetobacter calcoaceticus TaxID=471 RepID=A0A4R1XIU7_ACICA|nr:hypothetical protein EC844_12336 [Acinetobacter calcoaceticus]